MTKKNSAEYRVSPECSYTGALIRVRALTLLVAVGQLAAGQVVSPNSGDEH